MQRDRKSGFAQDDDFVEGVGKHLRGCAYKKNSQALGMAREVSGFPLSAVARVANCRSLHFGRDDNSVARPADGFGAHIGTADPSASLRCARDDKGKVCVSIERSGPIGRTADPSASLGMTDRVR